MKIFFKTLGCRLNQAETEKLKLEALKRGLQLASGEKSADIFVLNSCSVTDKAQRDTRKMLEKLKVKYPKIELVVIGCGARDEYKKYAEVISNDKKDDLFSIIPVKMEESLSKSMSFRTRSEIYTNKDWILNQVQNDKSRTRLMIKVQTGCNNFCSYCIVPYLRGREKSLNPDVILTDLKQAEKRGYKEVVLCGVNIGRWDSVGVVEDVGNVGSEKTNKSHERSDSTVPTNILHLADLIAKILKETTFPRIRLSSINPDDFSDDLIYLWSKEPRLCPHFHISLQSGSDTVLERMRRKYDTKQYADLVLRLRKKIPNVQITTDVIVGFPGETDKEFEETAEFVKKMQFLKVHVFRYSPRAGTKAATMDGQVSEKVKKERAVELQKLESDIRQNILRDYVGKEIEVLFEQEQKLRHPDGGHTGCEVDGATLKDKKCFPGFTPNYIKVFLHSDKDLTNRIVKVKISDSATNELIG